MRTELYWIPATTPGRLAIMARPRGGDWLEEEVRSWRSAGVDVILSLLEPVEVAELDLSHEETVCENEGIHFLSFPIVDRGVPLSRDALLKLATKLSSSLMKGNNVAIHCRQGIGRAALVAICVLIRLGVELEKAVTDVSAARERPVPETREQKRWIADFVREYVVPVAS